ncbi:hypothetical protein ADP71_17160 [Vitreoscilla sp. C1]|uniref:hypothetical protein n=1 Tax=Vitreoscilla sp. (strain C1) TaxID=96942 RepID=UPI00148ED246|nr:hypothetical protein [Vitreoscilla sp. C1]AUZ05243.2 hypothetical protein ADP71_17160 [Vitreoscilla sp. C1]
MFKKLMLVFLALLISGAVNATNLIKESYGNWYGYEEAVSISKQGLDKYAQAVVDCGGVKHKMSQNIAIYSGSELIARIEEAIEFGDDSKSLKAAKLMIHPDKKYQAIEILPPECADGSVTFVQLNANTGLYIETAPDDVFYVIKKK